MSPLASPFPSPLSLIRHHELPNPLSLTVGSAAMNCLRDSCDARSNGPGHAIAQGPPDPLLLQGRANALLLILLGAVPDPREDTTARGRATAPGHTAARGGGAAPLLGSQVVPSHRIQRRRGPVPSHDGEGQAPRRATPLENKAAHRTAPSEGPRARDPPRSLAVRERERERTPSSIVEKGAMPV